jgi:preprotein translocase subunit YajC
VTLEIGQAGDKPIETVVQRSAVTSVLPKGTIKSL